MKISMTQNSINRTRTIVRLAETQWSIANCAMPSVVGLSLRPGFISLGAELTPKHTESPNFLGYSDRHHNQS